MTHCFSKPGKENTAETLNIAKEEALRRGIGFVLVASTSGETGVKAARIFNGTDIRLIIVTHNTGFKEPGIQELKEEIRKEIAGLGGTVHTGTMVLRGLGAAIRDRNAYCQEQLVADTLRMFGQGVKVCVEVVAMASDSGLIPPDDVIAVGGTRTGADTAAVLKANSSNHFFEIKIKEILAKPANF